MYEKFYGFREKPFSILPDPAFLYLSRKHRRALTMLEYGIRNQAGFSVITGAIGSGKTTLVRRLLGQVDRSLNIGLVSNTQCESFEELLQWVLLAFDLEYRAKEKVELYHAFSDFLVKEHVAGRQVVLIVDEAQHLGPAPLEQLRMLSNVNADKHQFLQLVLVGQPDLRDLLRRAELVQFAQRVAIAYHLEPLDLAETQEYVRHRLVVAGGTPDIFAVDTHDYIWQISGGVPRVINLLCDAALVYGMAEQKRSIDRALLTDVVKDREMDVTPIAESHWGSSEAGGQVPTLTEIVWK